MTVTDFKPSPRHALVIPSPARYFFDKAEIESSWFRRLPRHDPEKRNQDLKGAVADHEISLYF